MRWWRATALVVGFGVLAWVGFEIGRAGSDISVPRVAGPGTMSGGRMEAKRLDNKSWSLDYDTITLSPDHSIITISHVRDGRIHRPGKPDVLLKADGVQLNQTTNDLNVAGAVHITENEGAGHTRTFDSVGARYNGFAHELTLDHTATITDGGTKVVVAKATVNFRTGEVNLGPIEGTKTGG